MAFLDRRAFSQLVDVGRPFFVSSHRWRAIGALAVILTLLLALNGLNVLNSYVGRNFISAIAARNQPRYVLFTALYVLVFAASTVTGVMQQYVQDRLALSWRDWLTRHFVVQYLSGRVYERISAHREIDNPDERIAQDVRAFTSTLVSFAVMTTNAVLTTIAFAGVLWSIAPSLVVTAVLYAAFGSVLTIGLGRTLVGLNDRQLKREADMRYALIHAREHAGVGDASAGESRRVRVRLRRVVRNAASIIRVTRNVSFFTSGYGYLVQILPIVLVVPRYLAGEIELGVVTQSAMAFAQVLGAFSLIVVQFQTISSFTAVLRRVGSLWDGMKPEAPVAEKLAPSGMAT
jgi:putative ATP-binding cassette transporter